MAKATQNRSMCMRVVLQLDCSPVKNPKKVGPRNADISFVGLSRLISSRVSFLNCNNKRRDGHGQSQSSHARRTSEQEMKVDRADHRNNHKFTVKHKGSYMEKKHYRHHDDDDKMSMAQFKYARRYRAAAKGKS